METIYIDNLDPSAYAGRVYYKWKNYVSLNFNTVEVLARQFAGSGPTETITKFFGEKLIANFYIIPSNS